MAARGVAGQRATRPRTNLKVPTGGTPIVRSAALDPKLRAVENHTRGPVGGHGRTSAGKGD